MEAVALERGFSPDPPTPTAGAAPRLTELRRAAFARFEQLGFPTPKNEEWRSTGLQPITGTTWARARLEPGIQGFPAAGVRLHRMSEAALDVEPLFARIAGFEQSAFTALNTALHDDAIIVAIDAGAVISDPIEIVFSSGGEASPVVSYPRLLILAGEGSQASVVQKYSGEGRYFTNAVTEIAVAEGAMLEHTTLQRESEQACHVHALAVRQARASHFTSHNLVFGAALARTDLGVVLAGEGAECTLNGLFVGERSQHLDTHTTIDHAKPRCVSRELYKGILDGSSRGVFHGKILVRPDAQKTDAVQYNKNLLLSRHALVNSTPALEILADDVKCKHGSTTGQLDPAALFYLRSRGIDEAAARALLTRAFAADVAERIKIPSVRAEVERELGQRLGSTAEAAR
jgi:Fe-S cluster assembly protein SufD